MAKALNSTMYYIEPVHCAVHHGGNITMLYIEYVHFAVHHGWSREQQTILFRAGIVHT